MNVVRIGQDIYQKIPDGWMFKTVSKHETKKATCSVTKKVKIYVTELQLQWIQEWDTLETSQYEI